MKGCVRIRCFLKSWVATRGTQPLKVTAAVDAIRGRQIKRRPRAARSAKTCYLPITATIVAQKVNTQVEPNVATDRPVYEIQTRNLALTAARDTRPRRKRINCEPGIAYPKTRNLS